MSGWPVVGMGVVSPAGRGRERFWRACADGPVPPRPVDHLDVTGIEGYPVGLVPELAGVRARGDAGRWVDLAVAAGQEALAEASSVGDVPADRRALVLGSTDYTGFEVDHEEAGAQVRHCDPAAVAERLGIAGPVLMTSNASAAGAAALVVAADLLAAGVTDRVTVIGVDCITRTGLYGLVALRALSKQGCRPFAADRRGIHLAECSAAVVLDRRPVPHACRMTGGWVSNVAGQYARPEVEGLIDVIGRACTRAGILPSELDHVNAHAAGTQQGDLAELTALEQLLGPAVRDIPVLSVKGILGHCQGAAGVLEAIATVRALQEGVPPVLAGVDDVDPRWSQQNFGQRRTTRPLHRAVSISCGLGGVNAAVVMESTTPAAMSSGANGRAAE